MLLATKVLIALRYCAGDENVDFPVTTSAFPDTFVDRHFMLSLPTVTSLYQVQVRSTVWLKASPLQWHPQSKICRVLFFSHFVSTFSVMFSRNCALHLAFFSYFLFDYIRKTNFSWCFLCRVAEGQ